MNKNLIFNSFEKKAFCSFICMMLLSFSNIAHTQSFEKTLKFCTVTSYWLPIIFENAGVTGESICKVSNGSSCYNVKSLGEGICKAGNGSSCYNVKSLGEGVCKAGNGSGCYNVSSLREGLCKVAGICNAESAIDIINSAIKICGTKVLHFGFNQ